MNGRAKLNRKELTATVSSSLANPLYTEPAFDGKAYYDIVNLGLQVRTRMGLMPEINRVKSMYAQSKLINTTERSIGMPVGSSDNIVHRPTSVTGIQVSSSSASDTTAGTGAISIYIEGIYKSGSDWLERGTYSTPTTLSGQTAAQIGALTDWWRINKIWVYDTGSNDTNVGDLYISPLGTTLTAGVPDDSTMGAVIAGYGNSTMGHFTVGSDFRFEYTKGNLWGDTTKNLIIHEFFYQDFGNGKLNKYEVGLYPAVNTSYDYEGASPYTAKTDICLTVRTVSGTADILTYYIEYSITNANEVNL